jgi:hypothetical protein
MDKTEAILFLVLLPLLAVVLAQTTYLPATKRVAMVVLVAALEIHQ